MIVQQLYTNCLAQGAYYISHQGEAAIIDPLRETHSYTSLLTANGDRLKYIFETHFHADFVSGHVDLARETGASIVFGPNAVTSYPSHIATDNEEFSLGRLTIRALHTPGHTLESTTYLLLDESMKPLCIFTGDTLFIGDVGRPDLAIQSDLTQDDLAGMLYDSLRARIMPLPDDVLVYPAHGAGSACGKSMSKETWDTLGHQKQSNYALQDISRETFIRMLTEGILPAPQYFAKNAALNQKGYTDFSEVLSRSLHPLDPATFDSARQTRKALVLDVRTPEEFAAAHVPGALFIGLDGQFAPWTGTLIADLQTPILLVAPEGREAEAVTRLSRVGYDHCIGYLNGGMAAWQMAGRETEQVHNISAGEFATRYLAGVKTLDVRKPGEFEAGRLKQARSLPLDFIGSWLQELPKKEEYLVHCAGGYRSMIAISLMKAGGINRVINVAGGFGAISKVDAAASEISPVTAKV